MSDEPKEGDVIAVWFSCGAASAVAAKKTIEKYHNFCTIRVINNLVVEEDADNRRFLSDIEKWLGVTIESAMNDKYPNCSAREVWEKRGYMSGPKGAPCTYELKKMARRVWEENNHADWIVMGFTADEYIRFRNFQLSERWNILPILIDAELTKDHCFEIIQAAGIELPRIYKMGYPNANCIGCVKANSPTYWNHVRKTHPDIFNDRAEQSRRLGAKLVRVKGKRMYLDELDPNAVGRPMKTLKSVECGIYCEPEKIVSEHDEAMKKSQKLISLMDELLQPHRDKE